MSYPVRDLPGLACLLPKEDFPAKSSQFSPARPTKEGTCALCGLRDYGTVRAAPPGTRSPRL